MKSLNIDVIFPWEVGLVLVIMGLIFIVVGVRQSKKETDDFDKIPLTKPTTKIFFGGILLIFGLIQLLPLLKSL
jgi:ABC-type nickel/cobalt efflux system permease component RcnA